MSVTLTARAEAKLVSVLQSSTASQGNCAKGIRVAVTDGGCSGYQYALNVLNEPKESDVLIQEGEFQVYVNAQSLPLLEGVVIDYIEGLIQSGFKFSNPNATNTCSCGKSFQAGDCTPTEVACTSA